MEEKKEIGIGVEDDKVLTDKAYYDADKRLFLKEWLDKGGVVTLLTRPGLFGKTLTLNLLRTFLKQIGKEEIKVKKETEDGTKSRKPPTSSMRNTKWGTSLIRFN